ncbi:glycerol-3-phosphate dehydrogenase [Paenibacillus darwinianus]|uniref:Glycerol-3-phosphate dehydrogenase n=1 Tax=Paenibacillus darwinianus TaxID=1380763 RepID=A0A9W5S011_9BACL|nr:FAD-dependent oxidoreductase [Paenibacillus darwinianus]EXX86582.1 glycerol-3-phosphate dehydrogenase [Paenibacillus darwinianus]
MERPFCVKKRDQFITVLCEEPLDLLVIGGGITGAGIALDAQARGLRTGLIEMQDFAAGTSSRSTKLVHGGLRYLKQLHLKLVAEIGRERAIVYRNAPHVTTPVWMLLPIIDGGTFGTFSTSLALKLYDYLAQVERSERRKMLNKAATLSKEPLLQSAKLKGAGYYVEYRTDDARLTLEIMKKAVEYGASALNYMKAEELLYEEKRLVGVEATDCLTGHRYRIYAKKVINATGPWADLLREQDGSKKEKYLHLTKGVHLVVSGERFPLHEAVYFDTPFGDKRMIFAIPREGKTYIGTTDTNYNKDKDKANPLMTSEDVTYILQAVNWMFPMLRITPNDVESSWVGLRPLIHEEGKDPSEISRKDEVFLSSSGLITIAGGKLTGYRKMAEKVVDMVIEQIRIEDGRSFPTSCTDTIPLSGGGIAVNVFERYVDEQARAGEQVGILYEKSKRLTQRYGTNIATIYEIARKGEAIARRYGMPIDVYASLVYGIEHEMVAAPVDYFIRRTSALFFDISWVSMWKQQVIAYMADDLNWTHEQIEGYSQELEEALRMAVIPELSH